MSSGEEKSIPNRAQEVARQKDMFIVRKGRDETVVSY